MLPLAGPYAYAHQSVNSLIFKPYDQFGHMSKKTTGRKPTKSLQHVQAAAAPALEVPGGVFYEEFPEEIFCRGRLTPDIFSGIDEATRPQNE